MIYRLTLFLLVIIFIFSSCNDCHLVDCPTGVSFDIRIDDMSTGNTLLVESDSLYHIDEMSLTSLIDGQQIDGQLYRRSSVTNDSFPITCWSNVAPDMMFLKLSEEDTDTLSFISEYIEDECCSWYRLDSVSVNGAINVPVLNETITLLK